MIGWDQVWTERVDKLGLEHSGQFSLRDLIVLDGFDGGAGGLSEEEFVSGMRKLSRTLNLSEGQSLLELGCGAGALMASIMPKLTLTGIDISKQLLAVAQQVLPHAELHRYDLNSQGGKYSSAFFGRKFDFIVAHSVFQYLSHSVASEVLRESLRLGNKAVFVGDIPNSADEVLAEEIREKALPPGEYRKKYRSLTHSYFEQSFFRNIQAEAEFSGQWSLQFGSEGLFQTPQSQLRFSALFVKLE